jgi:aminodeoxyfutalosine deaminase
MFDWLRRNERDMTDCGHARPSRNSSNWVTSTPRLLAIHLNYLATGDARLLARRGVHVVHCPRSHDYFGTGNSPTTAWPSAGVNLCLGTDSLVTVRKAHRENIALDLFAEMRALCARPSRGCAGGDPRDGHPQSRARFGAGQPDRGAAPGAAADLIAIPFTGATTEAATAVVHHPGPVSAAFIRGRSVLPRAGPE